MNSHIDLSARDFEGETLITIPCSLAEIAQMNRLLAGVEVIEGPHATLTLNEWDALSDATDIDYIGRLDGPLLAALRWKRNP